MLATLCVLVEVQAVTGLVIERDVIPTISLKRLEADRVSSDVVY